MTKPRVLFVISGLGRGGAENQLVQIAGALVSRGWQVTILTLLVPSRSSLADILEDTDVEIVSLDASSFWGRIKGVRLATYAIRRFRPHIVVGLMFHGMLVARICGRIAQVPAIVSSIHSERHGSHREALLRLTDHLSDAVVTMSPRLATRLADERVADARHTYVIANGIDVSKFQTRPDAKEIRYGLGIRDDEFLWLAVGTLRPEKDYPNLIRAVASLTERQPNARLVIAGEGPDLKDISDVICDSGLAGQITLLGLRDDLPDLYHTSDAFVLSSMIEGMPLVVLEAMACSKPVVATSVGAVREVVSDGETGFVVPPEDHHALADAMYRMMTVPPGVRHAMGEAGFRRMKEEFSLGRVVDQWEDLFRRLLQEKGIIPGGQSN